MTEEVYQQLGQELRSASMQDLIFRPACRKDYTMVLTLKQISGTEHELEDFLESESVVLGKLTKTIRNDDQINLLRRTSVKYMPDYNKVLEDHLAALGFANILKEDTIVKAPSIQIRPLAIFT